MQYKTRLKHDFKNETKRNRETHIARINFIYIKHSCVILNLAQIHRKNIKFFLYELNRPFK